MCLGIYDIFTTAVNKLEYGFFSSGLKDPAPSSNSVLSQSYFAWNKYLCMHWGWELSKNDWCLTLLFANVFIALSTK